MKAILVIDIPYIDKKQINYLSVSFGGIPYYIGRDAMMLRPLPKKEEKPTKGEDDYNDFCIGYTRGWNDCLDEIIGETG